MGPGGPPGLQNRPLPAHAGGLGSTPRRFRHSPRQQYDRGMHDLPLLTTLAGGLSVALVLGYITQRIGLSSIVGYLIAGTLVGPHTPGFIADAAGIVPSRRGRAAQGRSGRSVLG